MIEVMAHKAFHSLISDIQSHKWYYILADETQDLSNHEQRSTECFDGSYSNDKLFPKCQAMFESIQKREEPRAVTVGIQTLCPSRWIVRIGAM